MVLTLSMPSGRRREHSLCQAAQLKRVFYLCVTLFAWVMHQKAQPKHTAGLQYICTGRHIACFIAWGPISACMNLMYSICWLRDVALSSTHFVLLPESWLDEVNPRLLGMATMAATIAYRLVVMDRLVVMCLRYSENNWRLGFCVTPSHKRFMLRNWN